MNLEQAQNLIADIEALLAYVEGDDGQGKPGLLREINLARECLESAIADLGGAYDSESEAADRLEKALASINDLSIHIKEGIANKDVIRDQVLASVDEGIKQARQQLDSRLSEVISESLEAALTKERKNIEESLNGYSVTESKAALVAKIHELSNRNAELEKDYDEVRKFRENRGFKTIISLAGWGGYLLYFVVILM